MASSSSRTELLLRREERETISPDRSVVWKEPHNNKLMKRTVPVVYYLSRNGHLDHPHFMEVPLSSPPALFLTDVIDRLNALRGKGMASMYSWSCKRRYKNGFVWHDLSESDLIHPAHFNDDYVLKGSELPPKNALLDSSSPFTPPPPDIQKTGDLDHRRRRRHQSCSSVDFEYSVYKAEPSSGSAADASTQTDDSRRHRRRRPPAPDMVEEKEENGKEPQRDEIEISPPPSDSSPETLETLMKADRRAVEKGNGGEHDRMERSRSSVLMQLISCGSISCGAGMGMGLMGQQYKMMVPRGVERRRGRLEMGEKQYFSGTLVETKKDKFPADLKRSTSYTAHRNRRPDVEVGEKEEESVIGKCIPRKPKA